MYKQWNVMVNYNNRTKCAKDRGSDIPNINQVLVTYSAFLCFLNQKTAASTLITVTNIAEHRVLLHFLIILF